MAGMIEPEASVNGDVDSNAHCSKTLDYIHQVCYRSLKDAVTFMQSIFNGCKVIGKKVHGNNVHGKKRPRNKGPSENEEGGKNVHIRAEKSSIYIS